MEYNNLYYSEKGSHNYAAPTEAYRDNVVPGFTTSSKTRPLIIAKLEEFIRNKLIILYSQRIINEFKTFVWQNNRAQAMRSYHDDLVMALAIACWVKDTALTINQRELQYKKAMVSSMFSTQGKLQTTIPGMQGHKIDSFSQETMDRKKQYEQFVWLLKG
jgi:hypothetical protein